MGASAASPDSPKADPLAKAILTGVGRATVAVPTVVSEKVFPTAYSSQPTRVPARATPPMAQRQSPPASTARNLTTLC